MSLLQEWRESAYSLDINSKEGKLFWNNYFVLEKGVYEQLLSNPDMVEEGTVKQLAEKYNVQLPIIEQVNLVLFHGKSADQAVKDLMLRDKKIEVSDIPWTV